MTGVQTCALPISPPSPPLQLAALSMVAPIAISMFAIPPVLNVGVALSIPLFFPGFLNFAILGITLSSNTLDGNLAFLNPDSGFDGLLNNLSVTNLLNVQVSNDNTVCLSVCLSRLWHSSSI